MRLSDLRQDVAYAARLIRRAPGFSAVVIATVALGIGATTAIFTVVDAVLLRPLQFGEPDRLAVVRPTSGARLSATYLYEWRRQSHTFQDIAGWYDEPANFTGRGEPLEVVVDHVTPNFFAMLGTPPMIGRTIAGADDLGRAERAVVLSHGFWQRRLGSDPAVIGQAVTLDGEAFTIVGVMPRTFVIRTNELAESRAELWMPFALVPDNKPGMGGVLNVVGRLARGVTVEQARAELASIAQRIEQQHPSYSRHWGVSLVPLQEATVQDVRLTLLVLFGAVAILLLLGCANIANLVLSRITARQSELVVRLSLGATRKRLVKQVLTESLVLGTMGGALGMVLSVWGTKLLISAVPAGLDLPRTREIAVDVPILLFSALVTISATFFFGLLPALVSTRSTSLDAVRVAHRGVSSGGTRNRIVSSLIVSEIALGAILLVLAGLIGRSFWTLSRVHPGFQPDHVLTVRTTLAPSTYDSDDRIRTFGNSILERTTRLPGVRTVGLADYLPLSRDGRGEIFRIEGRPEPRPEDQPGSLVTVVGGRYFEAMGIPLIRGRLPDDRDTSRGETVFVIDETLAREYWRDSDPIGARLLWHTGDGWSRSGVVIGVVRSVHWIGLATRPWATTYFWFPQRPHRQLSIVVRTVGDPGKLARAVALQVRSIDPNQPVADVRALQDFVSADLAQPRFTAVILTGFGTAALLLAGAGLYGVIALWVAQRTREIGVRLALGARRQDVLRLVATRGLRLTALGLAFGIAIALGAGRALTGLLYGVTPADPLTLIGAALFLTCVATGAIYFPARRATRVDPMITLRAE